MALDFTGASDKVNYGSASVLDDIAANDGTMMLWLYPDASPPAADGTFVRKSLTGFTFNPDTAGTIQLSITRATTNLRAQATLANLSTYGASKWCCIACTWDTDIVAANLPKLFHGDLTTPMAEAAAYSAQQVGTGTVTDTSGLDFLVGNSSANNRVFDGKIALVAAWNRRLSLEELIAQQWRFRPTGPSDCVLFSPIGYNGTGTQPDWSGNGNAGTVTGTAVADHVPLLFRRYGQLYVPYTVAAAGVKPWWHYPQYISQIGAA